MSAYKDIKDRQIAWARSRGIQLVGSVWVHGIPEDQQDHRGEKAYTTTIEQNLFVPLTEATRREFRRGKGRELDNKMRAVHSSAALIVNLFDYCRAWREVAEIAHACDFGSTDIDEVNQMEFEATFEVVGGGHPSAGLFKTPPHLDCAIYYQGDGYSVAAVESKFTEPFMPGRTCKPLAEAYLELTDVWADFPELKELAKALTMKGLAPFEFLDGAQLTRHLLGLVNTYGRTKFRLLYLYYDVPGREGEIHRDEVSRFQQVANAEGLRFDSLSHQQLIERLRRLAGFRHKEYVDYLEHRYVLSPRDL